MIKGMGIPKTVPSPRKRKLRGKPAITYPLVTTRAIPLIKIIIPRVAIIAGIEQKATSVPFRTPNPRERSKPKTMAQKGESSNWVIDKAITIAERLAVETIDRSIPPVNMGDI